MHELQLWSCFSFQLSTNSFFPSVLFSPSLFLLILGLAHLRGCVCVYVCVCLCLCVCVCVSVCVCAMQSCGAGASLPDSRDLAALAVGHTSTRQEEVATALSHFPHTPPSLVHLPPSFIFLTFIAALKATIVAKMIINCPNCHVNLIANQTNVVKDTSSPSASKHTSSHASFILKTNDSFHCQIIYCLCWW